MTRSAEALEAPFVLASPSPEKHDVIDLYRGSIATGKQFQTVVAKFSTWPVAVSPSLRRITVQGVPAIADALASKGVTHLRAANVP